MVNLCSCVSQDSRTLPFFSRKRKFVSPVYKTATKIVRVARRAPVCSLTPDKAAIIQKTTAVSLTTKDDESVYLLPDEVKSDTSVNSATGECFQIAHFAANISMLLEGTRHLDETLVFILAAIRCAFLLVAQMCLIIDFCEYYFFSTMAARRLTSRRLFCILP